MIGCVKQVERVSPSSSDASDDDDNDEAALLFVIEDILLVRLSLNSKI